MLSGMCMDCWDDNQRRTRNRIVDEEDVEMEEQSAQGEDEDMQAAEKANASNSEEESTSKRQSPKKMASKQKYTKEKQYNCMAPDCAKVFDTAGKRA